MATKKKQRMFVAVRASSPLHCYVTVEQAIAGARQWFTSERSYEDVMIYEMVPIRRVSPSVDVTVKAPGTITITKRES